MIRGAIFDLDGTLLDSMGLWDNVAEDYLRSLGMEPRENLSETFKTFTLEQSARYYREQYGVTLSVEQIVGGICGMVERFYRETVELKPGVADFLRRLRERDVKLCVATVTSKPLAEAALERLGVRGYFSQVFTCDGKDYGKEVPTLYREALASLGTQKEETPVFEDAFHAMCTAKSDGFPVVGVYDPWEGQKDEAKALADCWVEDYRSAEDFWRYMEK